jgi:hypothetical protein
MTSDVDVIRMWRGLVEIAVISISSPVPVRNGSRVT